jgi:alpha-tubulin suppressor-like RCC1 family protein
MCTGSIKIVYEPQPTPAMIKDLEQINIVRLACGHNHTIAIDDKGHAFTWGNGNYGKLGHKVNRAGRVCRCRSGRSCWGQEYSTHVGRKLLLTPFAGMTGRE